MKNSDHCNPLSYLFNYWSTTSSLFTCQVTSKHIRCVMESHPINFSYAITSLQHHITNSWYVHFQTKKKILNYLTENLEYIRRRKWLLLSFHSLCIIQQCTIQMDRKQQVCFMCPILLWCTLISQQNIILSSINLSLL